jgi:hypothetical protein
MSTEAIDVDEEEQLEASDEEDDDDFDDDDDDDDDSDSSSSESEVPQKKRSRISFSSSSSPGQPKLAALWSGSGNSQGNVLSQAQIEQVIETKRQNPPAGYRPIDWPPRMLKPPISPIVHNGILMWHEEEGWC